MTLEIGSETTICKYYESRVNLDINFLELWRLQFMLLIIFMLFNIFYNLYEKMLMIKLYMQYHEQVINSFILNVVYVYKFVYAYG